MSMELFCIVRGESTLKAFSVTTEDISIDNLKELIRVKKQNDFHDIDANNLMLWAVSIKDDDEDGLKLTAAGLKEDTQLRPTWKITRAFPNGLTEGHIHVIVEGPSDGQALADEHDAKRLRLDQPLSEPWVKAPINSSFKDALGPFQILNHSLYEQACNVMKSPKNSFAKGEQHPKFACFLDGPGVGKSRFLREVATNVDTHAIWTSFEYGMFGSVISGVSNVENLEKSASEIVTYLSNLWFTAFGMIFRQIVIQLIQSNSNERLSMFLTEGSLPRLDNPRKFMETQITQLSSLMGSRALILILDEAQLMGTPPPQMKSKSSTIDELIEQVKKTYSPDSSIDSTNMLTARQFLSVSFHKVLQAVVPIALTHNIAVAVLGLDPSLVLYNALVRSGLGVFSFCENTADLLPYFEYKHIKIVLSNYINIKSFTEIELVKIISKLTGPPRIVEIFLETFWKCRNENCSLQSLVNSAFESFSQRYNVKDSQDLFRKFYRLLFFYDTLGGSILLASEDNAEIRVSYNSDSLGYKIIMENHTAITMAGLLRIEQGAEEFRIRQPYPFAHMALRQSSGLNLDNKDIIKENLLQMKELGGHVFEFAVAKELSYSFSPIYAVILRYTGYNALPNLKQMQYLAFNRINPEERNDEKILSNEKKQYVRWIRDKNSADKMKVDIWTFGYNPKSGNDLPQVIDIFVQVTKEQKGSGLDSKLKDTLSLWLAGETVLRDKPAILLFISRHPVTIPSIIKWEKDGTVHFTGTQSRKSSNRPEVKHWLFIMAGDESLSTTVVPLLELVDINAAELDKVYNM